MKEKYTGIVLKIESLEKTDVLTTSLLKVGPEETPADNPVNENGYRSFSMVFSWFGK